MRSPWSVERFARGRNMFRYGRYEVRMKAPDVQPGNPDIDGHWD